MKAGRWSSCLSFTYLLSHSVIFISLFYFSAITWHYLNDYVKSIDVDDSQVDYNKEGEYEVIYTITFDKEKLQTFVKDENIEVPFDTEKDSIIIKVSTVVTVTDNEEEAEVENETTTNDTTDKTSEENQSETNNNSSSNSNSNTNNSSSAIQIVTVLPVLNLLTNMYGSVTLKLYRNQ